MGERDESPAALGNVLHPLFSQTHMRRFCAVFAGAYAVTSADSDLCAMLEAWSHFQELRVRLSS